MGRAGTRRNRPPRLLARDAWRSASTASLLPPSLPAPLGRLRRV